MSQPKKILIACGIGGVIMLVARFYIAGNILGNENPTFVENNIIGSQEISENKERENNISEKDQKENLPLHEINKGAKQENGSVVIAIPDIISEDSLKRFTSIINEKNNQNISLIVKKYESIQKLKQDITTGKLHIDIILLSSLGEIQFHKNRVSLPFKDNILSSFHPSIQGKITQSEMKHIPFGIDPLIYISPIGETFESIEDIERYFLKNTHAQHYFGISEIDIRFLKENRHPLVPYQEILEQVIGLSFNKSSQDILDWLIGNPYWSFRSTYKASRSRSSVCTKNELSCMLLQEKDSAGILPLSAYLKAQAALQKEGVILPEKKVSHIPGFDTLYGNSRGFILLESEEPISSSINWLLGYIQYGGESNSPLREFSLSAFNGIISQQLKNRNLLGIKRRIETNNIIYHTSDINQLNIWNEQGPLRDVLEDTYSTKIYIDNQSK